MAVPGGVEVNQSDRIGSWIVRWSPHGFSVRGTRRDVRRSFVFSRIVLPIEMEIDPATKTGRVIIKQDPLTWLEVLDGTTQGDLLRFKKTVSAQVLAAVARDGVGCSDCAEESGRASRLGSEGACPGCREFYCQDRGCLRRLRLASTRDGKIRCKCCGADYGRTFSTANLTPRYANRRQPLRLEA